MSQPFAAGNKAFGFCDRCDFRYLLKELKAEVVDMEKTGLLVCEECWDPDHPQNLLGREPVNDPQALRNPRPDTGLTESRYGKDLVFDFTTAKTGTHTQGVSNVYHSLNNFVYRLNSQVNSSSSMTWNPDSFYATLSENPTGNNKYQILSREESFGGSDSLVDIDPSKYKELQISIRKSAPFSPIPESDKTWTGEAYGAFGFTTDDNPFSSTLTSMPEPDWGNGIGGWDLITLDLSNNSDWTSATAGKVTELQFRFYQYQGSSSGSIFDSYDLSWIKFIHY